MPVRTMQWRSGRARAHWLKALSPLATAAMRSGMAASLSVRQQRLRAHLLRRLADMRRPSEEMPWRSAGAIKITTARRPWETRPSQLDTRQLSLRARREASPSAATPTLRVRLRWRSASMPRRTVTARWRSAAAPVPSSKGTWPSVATLWPKADWMKASCGLRQRLVSRPLPTASALPRSEPWRKPVATVPPHWVSRRRQPAGRVLLWAQIRQRTEATAPQWAASQMPLPTGRRRWVTQRMRAGPARRPLAAMSTTVRAQAQPIRSPSAGNPKSPPQPPPALPSVLTPSRAMRAAWRWAMVLRRLRPNRSPPPPLAA
jgi:hypothetical protein